MPNCCSKCKDLWKDGKRCSDKSCVCHVEKIEKIQAWIAVDTKNGLPVSYLSVYEKEKDIRKDMPWPFKKGWVKAVSCTIIINNK